MTRAEEKLPISGSLPSFMSATEWLNSPPLSPDDLRGNVVLVSFWTYTCINWLRTLPYIRAWAKRYKNQGLIVIGVHTPEFSFEHNIDNVEQAVQDMHIEYPVVIDNDYAIWNAFDNHYWPALYFADNDGFIRYRQFGEGEYGMSERVIQQLLSGVAAKEFSKELVFVEPKGIELPADWDDVESPESYLGYNRTMGFLSPGGIVAGRRHMYDYPNQVRLNQWSLCGKWTVDAENVTLDEAHGKIAYRFHARDLNLVMGPIMPGSKVKFRVRIDQAPPKVAHGVDVNAQGEGTLDGQRVYQLIRQPQPITDRLFEIEFLDAGIAAFSFTFG